MSITDIGDHVSYKRFNETKDDGSEYYRVTVGEEIYSLYFPEEDNENQVTLMNITLGHKEYTLDLTQGQLSKLRELLAFAGI